MGKALGMQRAKAQRLRKVVLRGSAAGSRSFLLYAQPTPNMLSETSGAVVDMCTDEFSIDIKEPSPEDAIVVASLTLRKKKNAKVARRKEDSSKATEERAQSGASTCTLNFNKQETRWPLKISEC
ncbi:hypothetical protein, unlikely [Trypanosoma brucei gambiense DAL972]|uniref:Uncharacterized protein n=1 Tax=Trypanosoma brucei gambiense (strain MHOM/CI/86/DAL972) TaxID=679716 RepID=D0A5U3_TRYB9|nr:hypothetical protein, unlikely [Trypanosoma brucei gambiense DAL972]CBH17044.1 hypothetical protein, unlikely [Trypanosoma brucei gambiense DAL972]|eukprot:XP_011779308.1 hypothetical protein, unlikely [Trypanosoma brucei gambiense DAL972]